MDILNTMKSALGIGAAEKESGMMATIMNLFGGSGGGLQGLVNRFSEKGMGDIVNSWVSTGQNLPVTPEQIRSVVGNETVNTLAAKFGMDATTFTNKLSTMLPQFVDKMTPEGKVPEGDVLSRGMETLGGMFGKK